MIAALSVVDWEKDVGVVSLEMEKIGLGPRLREQLKQGGSDGATGATAGPEGRAARSIASGK